MSIDLTNGLIFDDAPEHYIAFGDFDSRNYGFHLHERVAPTPEERPSTVSLPFMQGAISIYPRGCRIYENREITYIFYRPNTEEAAANVLQTTIENQIMGETSQVLMDSYDLKHHYVGKCSGIETTDDYAYKRLIVKITFALYPFKIGNEAVGDELWDTFNFETDTFWNVKFEVKKGQTLTIELFNPSQNIHTPKIYAYTADPPDGSTPAEILEWAELAALRITKDGVTFAMTQGENNPHLRLALGLNTMTLTGIGTIEFLWHRELI